MTCPSSYAEAYDFALTWCVQTVFAGLDDGGGAAVAFLTDTAMNWLAPADGGDPISVGMPVYNQTTGTYGKVTSVAATVLGTTNTWSNGDEYRVMPLPLAAVATTEHFLRIAANDINMARMASGGCDCTLSTAGSEALRFLNVVTAVVWYNCPCGNPNIREPERFDAYNTYARDTLENLRTGKLEVCQGETGSEFPSVDHAEQSVTIWGPGRVIWNTERRNS